MEVGTGKRLMLSTYSSSYTVIIKAQMLKFFCVINVPPINDDRIVHQFQ